MRAWFVYGLAAAAMVLAKAMPAMAATSWEVCLNPVAVESGGDLNISVEGETVGTSVLPIFFSTVVYVYPAGTFQPSTKTPRTSCTTNTAPVGTFLARAGLVANLPTAISGSSPMCIMWTGILRSSAWGSLARAVSLNREIPASPLARQSQVAPVGYPRQALQLCSSLVTQGTSLKIPSTYIE